MVLRYPCLPSTQADQSYTAMGFEHKRNNDKSGCIIALLSRTLAIVKVLELGQSASLSSPVPSPLSDQARTVESIGDPSHVNLPQIGYATFDPTLTLEYETS